MADSFDVVAVWITNESAVVVRVIDRPEPWRAVARAAGCERRRIEAVNRCAICREKGDMHARLDPCPARNPKIRLAILAKSTGRLIACHFGWNLMQQTDPEWR